MLFWLGLKIIHVCFRVFLDYTVQTGAHNARTLIPVNIHTQTLPL
jgi:hypothetical protein